jgi:hypothetical protein
MASPIEEGRELRKLWSGFMGSRVVLTANNLDVFDHLTAPRTAAEIAGMLQADGRGTEILLDALTALGLIRKTGKKYTNGALARKHLVRGTKLYMGDILRHADSLWHNWSNLDDIVMGRRPAPSEARHDHEAFIRGMDNLAAFKARSVVRAVGMKGVKKSLDVGGGPGTYSRAMVAAGVGEAVIFDLPATLEISRRINREAGATRLTFVEGDCLADQYGTGYELVFISQLLHAFGPEENRVILEKAHAALNHGGRIAVQEFLIADSMSAPLPSALFSVNMLVNTDRGRCYPPREIGGMMRKAGFTGITELLLDDTVVVVGTKQ